jgi:hypothetical protein
MTKRLVLFVLFALSSSALARNTGQIAADDPNRDWFSRAKVHACCDLRDGKFVDFRFNESTPSGFQIALEGQWIDVPVTAVRALDGERNPYLQALAWYGKMAHVDGEAVTPAWDIRCFIVGAGG